MAYSAGDTITASEYNTFITGDTSPFGINHVQGTGATVYGLGQAALPEVEGGADNNTTLHIYITPPTPPPPTPHISNNISGRPHRGTIAQATL